MIPLLLLAGCGDKIDFDPSAFSPSLQARYVRVNKDMFTCSSAGATNFNFVVTSIDTPWAFSDVLSWTSVSPMSGSQTADINLGVEENFSGDTERLGIFYLTSSAEDWDYSVPMTVSQPAATPSSTGMKCRFTQRMTSASGTGSP